jgi:hypothetical protein
VASAAFDQKGGFRAFAAVCTNDRVAVVGAGVPLRKDPVRRSADDRQFSSLVAAILSHDLFDLNHFTANRPAGIGRTQRKTRP